ncbi:DnaK system heat shock co-chaperone [Campylobacter ureolyticus RIGS 9880]|uniref:Chaperone protein DnaJ n=1 Tax=Campylobacter ureolyticus RIGS 9880 TaxID=1032069 RepID=A0AAU8TWY3_9BACT|nr:molecular chaperone DnaJ [Campylobacter ureolyticus]AKT90205.1 DnaK system heat shock co-chaperone [Campylobacter ureolyticus RIGS 9880]
MATELDYYEILEVSRNADSETIKKSFRKLALKYHPDRNQGDKDAEQKFKEINEAYQCLSDKNKREIYDRYGKDGLNNAGFSSGFGEGFSGFEDVMGDIFDSFFGGGRTSSRRRKKPIDNYDLDIEILVDLEFKEAVFGTQKELKYKIKKPCKECDGTGGEKTTCDYCGGRGQISQRQGFMSFVQTCPKCGGHGEMLKSKCPKCGGKGYEEIEQNFKFNIPKGVDTGIKIRISQKGNLSKDGSYGDLYAVIRVKEDDKFVRDGDDVYLEVPVFITQAMLGETIIIPTLDGQKELKLRVGTQDKEQFVLENEGIENLRTKKRGNLIAQISIKMPKKLNENQEKLIKELGKSFGIEPNKMVEESMFDKIKGWFK